LSRLHDTSRKKRDAEIARLEKEIADLSKSRGAADEERKRATEAEKEVARLKNLADLEKDKATKLTRELAEVKRNSESKTNALQDELSDLRRRDSSSARRIEDLERELSNNRVSEAQLTDLREEIDNNSEQARAVVAAMCSASRSLSSRSKPAADSSELLTLRFQVARLERKLADRVSQVDELVRVVRSLEEQTADLSRTLEDFDRVAPSHDPDFLIEGVLREELREREALACELRDDLDRLTLERDIETQWRLCLETDFETRLEAANIERELFLARLEGMKDLEVKAKELEQELERTSAAARAAADEAKAAQEDVAAKTTEVEGKRAEIEQLRADVDALNFEKTELNAEVGREKERNRKLASSLAQSRAAESALADDLATYVFSPALSV
jgi:chromosome segregation ATPase